MADSTPKQSPEQAETSAVLEQVKAEAKANFVAYQPESDKK